MPRIPFINGSCFILCIESFTFQLITFFNQGNMLTKCHLILNGICHRLHWQLKYLKNFCVFQFKFKPFSGTKILFYGYSEDERAHMVSELVRNGGIECTQQGDSSCTHVVVDDASVLELPDGVAPNDRIPVVKSEWFWASIQVKLINYWALL